MSAAAEVFFQCSDNLAREVRRINFAFHPPSSKGVPPCRLPDVLAILATTPATGEVLHSLYKGCHQATDRARTGLENFRDAAVSYVAQGKSEAHNAEAAVERTIREQPLTSVLLATGVGVLMGAIWCRR